MSGWVAALLIALAMVTTGTDDGPVDTAKDPVPVVADRFDGN